MEEKKMELPEIRKKLKELLVENLSLEDVSPEDIKDDEILFGEGLGLDSLDAVEIVVLLQRNFGIEIKDMKEGQKIFYSIDTLANYVYENR
ncbi:MAG: acyl carrier protein [Desulfobacterales bacterium]|nr:acyl carrier protein [Desulfobacterales bacterium]